MSDSLLAVDAGNTACKGLRIRPDGTIDAEASVFYSAAESIHDPHSWWRALDDVLRRLHARCPAPPAAICLCGRGNGVAFLDAGWQPVDLPWPDVLARARTYLRRPGVPGRAAGWETVYRAAVEIMPEAAGRIVRVCGVKDYLNLRLTGEWATDPSSAGCRTWPDGMRLEGLRREMLPPIHRADEVLGVASGETDLAIPPRLPVVVGSHDGVCANIGAGMLAAGEGCVTLGTQGVLRINTPEALSPTPSFATFTYPYLGETWTSGGDVLDGGAAVLWMTRLLGILHKDAHASNEAFAALDALAAAAPAGANGLLFVPYLRGTISPRYAVERRGMFRDVSAEHGPGDFARAAFEGTAFALRHIRDAFVAAVGVIRRLSLTGGGARSRVWPAIVASVLNTPFERVDPDASCRGAAVLAAVGLRRYPSVADACAAMVQHGGSVVPDAAWIARYEHLYGRYLSAADEATPGSETRQ